MLFERCLSIFTCGSRSRKCKFLSTTCPHQHSPHILPIANLLYSCIGIHTSSYQHPLHNMPTSHSAHTLSIDRSLIFVWVTWGRNVDLLIIWGALIDIFVGIMWAWGLYWLYVGSMWGDHWFSAHEFSTYYISCFWSAAPWTNTYESKNNLAVAVEICLWFLVGSTPKTNRFLARNHVSRAEL